MKKEDLKQIIEKNEIIRMCKSHFDSETVTQGITELVDAILEYSENYNEEITYDDVVEYMKGLHPSKAFATIRVTPHSENNNYEIEVFLYDDNKLGIVGDFGEHYDWDELEITDIIK